VKKLNDLSLLYVEDDFDAQEKMQLLLEDEVKELYQAFNGKDALEFYYRKQPDIIITDINMPHMDGLSFAQKIKEINEDQPVIIISGYDSRDNLLQSIDIGIDQFLQKPLDMELLFAKITKTMQKIQKEREKNKMAYYDRLTGIHNRYYFDISLDSLLQNFSNKKSSSLSLFLIDLDNFKTINDLYGHSAGDMVLKKLVTNIEAILTKKSVFARFEGDEFAILVEDFENIEAVEAFAKKLINITNFMVEFDVDTSHFYVDSPTEIVCITCSIGICYTQNNTSKETLTHSADAAMYKAKNSGKATYKIEVI
jgi:diguanylate cyclase (GGDEF)-like protein